MQRRVSPVLLAAIAMIIVLSVSVSVLLLGAVSGPPNIPSRRAQSQRTDQNVSDQPAKRADQAYFRPATEDVSGVPNNNKPYHRGPCPCLNTLANHGYIPRDGKNLTPLLLKRAIMDVFHVSDDLGQTLVDTLPNKTSMAMTLTLADLGVHNYIEHDASMVRDDAFFGHDPAGVNETLVRRMLAYATVDGTLTKKEVGRWRYERELESALNNPEYELTFARHAGAYAEAAALLIAMGDYDQEQISVAHAESFLLHERIPDDFVRSSTAISLPRALFVAAKIKIMASFPWRLFNAFGRRLRRAVDEEWAPAFPLSITL